MTWPMCAAIAAERHQKLRGFYEAFDLEVSGD